MASTPKTPAPSRSSKPAVRKTGVQRPKAATLGKKSDKPRVASVQTGENPSPLPPAIAAMAPLAVASGAGAATGSGASVEADEPAKLRKKELIERVITLSGAKKKDVKPIVEATLRALGDALTSGEELVLPPFGKAKVNRQKDLGQGEMLIVRLRRGGENETNKGSKPDVVGEADDESDDGA